MNLSEHQDYVKNALECVEFKLVRKPEDVHNNDLRFVPLMCHQIFGEQETIYGYKDPKIKLYYTAGLLNIYFDFQYKARINTTNTTTLCIKPDNVVKQITDILPENLSIITGNLNAFLEDMRKDECFMPPGVKLDQMEVKSKCESNTRIFEYYVCDLATPNFVQYRERFQTFVLWYIDAASYIDDDDPNWIFFLCYEKYKNSEGKTMYASVGYTSVYMHYAYPDKKRPRISQMIVLPPFQCMGVGAKCVQVIYNYFNRNAKVIEITVEDPSNNFIRIRNFINAKMCEKLPEFSSDNLKRGFTNEMKIVAQQKCKICPKQCRIIYEILRLNCTNKNNIEEYKAYRLDVKGRLNQLHHRTKLNLEKAGKLGLEIPSMTRFPTNEERIAELQREYEEIEKIYDEIVTRLKSDHFNY